jgi:AhpD family alkylhydroperoxidase
MRLDTPRVEPLADDEIDPEIRERFGEGPILNIFRTLAHHPKLMKRWLVFGNHVLAKSTLPPRERELVILRVGWLCRCGYEWGQHVAIARAAGLDDAEIERIAAGPDAEGWSERERLLLRATDELHADAFVSDATWTGLSAHLSTEQCIDLVFAVGQYNLVSMALNTLGVQPESEDFPPLPGV